ncbi:Protein damX, partial [human gut metagenome]
PQPQNQQQLNNVAVNSTLPTEPATVAPVRNGNASRDTAKTQTAERPATTRPARQQAVIEPKKPQATVKTEPKPVAQTPKRTEPAAPVASAKAPAATS